MDNNTSTFDCDVFGQVDQSFNINNTSNFDGDMFGQDDPFMINAFKSNSTNILDGDMFGQPDPFMTDVFKDNDTSFDGDMFGQPEPFMTNTSQDKIMGNSFESDFSSDNNLFGSFSDDMNIFTTAAPVAHREGSQGNELASSPPTQGSVGTHASPTPASMGPVESMWSTAYHDTSNNVAQKSDVELLYPLLDDLGYSGCDFVFPDTPQTSSPAAMVPMNPTPNTSPSAKKTRAKVTGGAKAPAKPRAPRKPSPSKAKPTGRVTKPTKAKAAPHNRTSSSPIERSLAELYNSPFISLSHGERARLMLPLLQGVDPNTGLKTGVAGSMVPPPDFEYIGADLSGGDVFANLGFTFPNTQVPSVSADYGTLRQREALERRPRR